VHADGSTLVQALLGRDDGLRQARALAVDYATEKQAFHLGARLDDPLPTRRREERARAA
jgi:hypothetical protein